MSTNVHIDLHTLVIDFSGDFVNAFIRILSELVQVSGFSFDDVQRAVGSVVERIPQNLVIDKNSQLFNLTQFATDVIDRLATAAGTALSLGSRNTFTCIQNAIKSNVNQTDVNLFIRTIEKIRRAFTVLDQVTKFLYSYTTTTLFTFPQNCVRRFVELNFCSRCTRRTPPLCSNTCGALIRGCLSAHYTALSRQFDILWNVSRQVLQVANDTLRTLFTEERQLIDHNALVTTIILCVFVNVLFSHYATTVDREIFVIKIFSSTTFPDEN